MGPYDNATSGEAHSTYVPVLSQEQQQQYEAAYTSAAQDYYVAPPPVQALPARLVQTKCKASSSSMDVCSCGLSPMGHLPYEDIAKARKLSQSSVFSGFSSSPSSTPYPHSPIVPTLTFITYPDLEPKDHSCGGEFDGHGDNNDKPRYGRHGKKLPKKELFLAACFFCRGRKIVCHPRKDVEEDKTCT
jgi:hypothetical protein